MKERRLSLLQHQVC